MAAGNCEMSICRVQAEDAEASGWQRGFRRRNPLLPMITIARS
jgi:hypothetical protein